jgi:hypothetical protein
VICQFCEIEYSEGTKVCAECGCELAEALPPESDEVVLEPLGVAYKRRQLAHLVERLETLGIPYVVYSGTALAMLESQGVKSVVFRSEWEARVLCMSSRREEAEVVWNEAEAMFEQEPNDAHVMAAEEAEPPAIGDRNAGIDPR